MVVARVVEPGVMTCGDPMISSAITVASGSGICAGTLMTIPAGFFANSSAGSGSARMYTLVALLAIGTVIVRSSGQLVTCMYSIPGRCVHRPNGSLNGNGLAAVPWID